MVPPVPINRLYGASLDQISWEYVHLDELDINGKLARLKNKKIAITYVPLHSSEEQRIYRFLKNGAVKTIGYNNGDYCRVSLHFGDNKTSTFIYGDSYPPNLPNITGFIRKIEPGD